jgi:hypothetical protein
MPEPETMTTPSETAEVLPPEPAGTGEPHMQKLHPAFAAHMWKPGQAPNPWGKHGAQGRMAALGLLDKILGEQETKEIMLAALRRYIRQRPVAAFKTLVMPLLPKDVRVDLGGERVIVWKSFLSDTGLTPDNSPSTPAGPGSDPSVAAGAGERPALPPLSFSTAPDARPEATTAGSPPPTSSQSEASTPAR